MKIVLTAALGLSLSFLGGCSPHPNTAATLLDASENTAARPWLVRVSSTFRGEDGGETLHLTGYGFLVRRDIPDGSSRYFVVTATHLAQGGVAQVMAETLPESSLDLKIEAQHAGQVRELVPVNRLASIRRDIEVIQVEVPEDVQPLAVVRQSDAPDALAVSHPYGWLEVVDPGMQDIAASATLGSGETYPLGLDAFIPEASFVRPVIPSPLSGVRAADVTAAMDDSADPWRRQVLRHGFDLAGDEVATYRRLPAGFSGAPLLLKLDGKLAVFGLVTSYSRAFELSWIAPSSFITRTIDLYVRNNLDQEPSRVGVRLNDEAWKLRNGLLYRVGTYGAELGNARFAEVSFLKAPAGNGSSSPGGNGSSSPGGNGSSSPGGNGSSSPGGNGSSSPGGNGSSSPGGNGSSSPGGDGPSSPGGNGSSSPGGDGTQDPMAFFGITYGLDFGAPSLTGGSVKKILGFQMDIDALGHHSTHFAEPNLAALNTVLNSLDPSQPQDGNLAPVVRAKPVTDFGDWLAQVEAHLQRSGFHRQGGEPYRKTLKMVALAVSPSAATRPLEAVVRVTSLPTPSLQISMTLNGKTYESSIIDSAEAIKPFLTLVAADKSQLVVSPAGLVNVDDSLRGPYDELVVASDPVRFAAMRGLDSRIKFPLLVGSESYLVVDGD